MWGAPVFRTNNSRATCAGYSQAWLVLSLLHGQPLTNPGLIQSQGQIESLHRGVGVRGNRGRTNGRPHIPLGSSSVRTLPESGLAICNGYPFEARWTGWDHIFATLAKQPSGHYYMTMKVPYAHAMACIITGGSVYYLEPEFGLVKFAADKFAVGATSFYQRYPWNPQNGYKFYKVQQA